MPVLRALGYTSAGLALAAAMLVAGPAAARALSRPQPVADFVLPTPAATPSPVPAGPYRVVGLGDSVPSGYACDCSSYVSQVGRYAATQHHTTAAVANLAKPGLTTSGLLKQLTDTSVRRRIAAADLVIITIGANDFDGDAVGDSSCGAPALSCFRTTLDHQATQLTSALREISDLHPATVLVTGYWNVFLDGDVAATHGTTYVHTSNALTLAENTQIAAITKARGDRYVDIYTPFKGTSGTRNDTPLLAPDGDHPNAAGHRTIATALEAALSVG